MATPLPVAPSAPQAAPSATPGPPLPAAGSEVGKTLRAAFGCSFAAVANLTAAERQHCQDRLAQGRPGAAAREFGVEPAKRAIFEANAKRALWWQEPFLATTPKNGCRPKVTNQQFAVAGGSRGASDWRAGISCGKSF
ncbi:MAG TPA: hypothetical protein VGG29_01120 [Caulobacteraceae bacterium]